MFVGRVIGAVVGFLAGGPLGALLGFAAGWFFDRGLRAARQRANPAMRAEVERAFFNAVFPLLGRLAKVDGRISEVEISGTETLMQRMGLGEADRQQAITLFKSGAQADFDVGQCVDEFLRHCGAYNNLRQLCLVYLITLALADHELHEAEERLLEDVAKRLGYSSFAFNHLLGMIQAQNHFFQRARDHNYTPSDGNPGELALAYQALGVEASVDDATLKKTYRKLMSEYHPDKLAGRGVPEDMVKVATERAQEIQAAYELIKKSRR